MNIYEKISEVMKEVRYLSKDDTVAFNSTKYKAISEEKVTSIIREQLIKQKLVIFPVQQTHKREGTLTTVDVTYRIVNSENPDEQIEVVSSGTGADTQDKGVGKAMTYAYKYMLLRTFAIPTGEDPDKVSSAELDEKGREWKEKEQQRQQIEAGRQKQKEQQRGKVTPEQRKKLEQYQNKCNVNLDYWIISNGVTWETLTENDAAAMITACQRKYGEV